MSHCLQSVEMCVQLLDEVFGHQSLTGAELHSAHTGGQDSDLSDDCLWLKKQRLTTSIKYVHINNITKYPVYGSLQYWQREQPPQITLSANREFVVLKQYRQSCSLSQQQLNLRAERLAGELTSL